MSMVTYPLNNIEYTAEDAELFHSTRTSGVYAIDSFNYSVSGADNTVVIGTGIAWIKNSEFSGKVVAQKEPVSIGIGLSDPNYERIDAIAIQFDANKNASEIVVKNGVPGSNPTAPSVVRTENLYELHLYHVRRSAGSLTISANNITDLRSDNNYCGLMTDSVTQAVDTTLSKHGVAADSATVGAALTGKAPAGYGLGASALNYPPDRNVESITQTGWYAVDGNVTGTAIHGIDGYTINNGLVRAEAKDANNITLTLYTRYSYNSILIKKKSQGVWYPWEWLNPMMVLGKEYRTIERWNEKVVYTKLIDFGSLPVGTSTTPKVKKVDSGISYSKIIEMRANVYDDSLELFAHSPLIANSGDLEYKAHIEGTKIAIIATGDYSSFYAHVLLKYTKD